MMRNNLAYSGKSDPCRYHTVDHDTVTDKVHVVTRSEDGTTASYQFDSFEDARQFFRTITKKLNGIAQHR